MQMKFKEPLRLQLEKKYLYAHFKHFSKLTRYINWQIVFMIWVKLWKTWLAMSAKRTSPNETTLQDTHFKSVLEVGVALSIFSTQIMNIFNLYSK